MTLSQYHQKYANYSEEEIGKRVNEKENELKRIFGAVSLQTNSQLVKIGILGCGDKRFISYHKQIFEECLKEDIEMVTFDITTEHLGGGENVVQHDCTKPLPDSPYDITYSHVLLKFIETGKQFDVLLNSFDALKKGGVAIHVLDREDYSVKEPKTGDNYYSVPLERWKVELDKRNIKYEQVPIKYGIALVLIKG